MKKKLLLIAILLFTGCSNTIMEKPFVIIDKYIEFGHWHYVYQDANGYERQFIEDSIHYSIGDTIK